jgi:hypothetical protein
MAVPEGGFGKRLDDIHAFHAERGLKAQSGRSRRLADRDFVRWYFVDSATPASSRPCSVA